MWERTHLWPLQSFDLCHFHVCYIFIGNVSLMNVSHDIFSSYLVFFTVRDSSTGAFRFLGLSGDMGGRWKVLNWSFACNIYI